MSPGYLLPMRHSIPRLFAAPSRGCNFDVHMIVCVHMRQDVCYTHTIVCMLQRHSPNAASSPRSVPHRDDISSAKPPDNHLPSIPRLHTHTCAHLHSSLSQPQPPDSIRTQSCLYHPAKTASLPPRRRCWSMLWRSSLTSSPPSTWSSLPLPSPPPPPPLTPSARGPYKWYLFSPPSPPPLAPYVPATRCPVLT
eukprot:3485188-Rhodomonas_salina.1